MGLDRNGSRFLFHAKSIGVQFGSTLMVGRQDLHVDKQTVIDMVDEYRPHCVDDAGKIVEQSEWRYAEDLIRCVGANVVESMDHSSFEGAAICHDLNDPIPSELQQKYDAVLDGGTLEHIFDVKQAYRNCMEMVKVGGHYLAISPSNNFMGHGFYQFSPEFFFEALSESNGYEIQQVILFEHRKKAPWYEVVAPTDIKSRVSLKNSERTYVLVIAKRISDATPFAKAPQQSDYEAAWQGEKTAPTRSARDNGFVSALSENVKRIGCKVLRRSYFEPLYFRRIR